MDNELDELLCLLDGKITAYRMKNPSNGANNIHRINLIKLQDEIQKMWDENREV